jgi:aminoglycoside phosphotransferase (APT) family kinase protein
MRDLDNLKNTERTLSRILGQSDLHLKLVLNGVNKTLAGHCAQGDFYLRLSPELLHSSLEVKREATTLARITDHDASIAVKPFLGSQHAGAAFAWDDEPYFGIATAVAAGASYDDSTEHMKYFGYVLAKLHAVPLIDEIEPESLGTTDVALSRGDLDRLSEQISLVQDSALEWAASGRPTHSGSKSIRHGDAWPGNGRFRGSEVTLFDFEHSSVGDPIADFANVAWWLTGAHHSPQLKSELWGAFLYGYSEFHDALRPNLCNRPIGTACRLTS